MIAGLDLSLNHGACVTLNRAGEIAGWDFVTDKVAPVKRSRGHGTRLKIKKEDAKDPERRQMVRRAFWFDWLKSTIGGAGYVGIENYAYGAVTNSAYQYGELGGDARRIACFDHGARLRAHDPLSVKMFATGKGNAIKTTLLDALPPELSKAFRYPEATLKGEASAEDLADAYWVARLVWTELELRAGRMLLSDLDPSRVRVFNRVTKTYPVNLLDREWLERP